MFRIIGPRLATMAVRRGGAVHSPLISTSKVSSTGPIIRTIVKVTKNTDALKVNNLKTLNEDVLRLHAQGNFTQASYAADYAIQKCREAFGNDHVSLAAAYANRGFIAKEMGDFDDAVELYEEALKIYDKQENTVHGKTIVLQNLGNVLRSLSNTQKDEKKKMEMRYRAKTVLEDAVKAIKDSEGPTSVKYASAVQKLANLSKDLKNLDQAESSLREAMAVAEKADPQSRVLFSIKNDLGLVLKLKGNAFDEARQLYESAVEYALARFGKEHKETIIYRHNLAELLDSQEETKQEANKIRLNILMTDVKKDGSPK